MSKLMTFEHGGLRFEKYDDNAIVNVHDKEGKNFFAFTHDEIGSSTKKFKESCIETYEYLKDAGEL